MPKLSRSISVSAQKLGRQMSVKRTNTNEGSVTVDPLSNFEGIAVVDDLSVLKDSSNELERQSHQQQKIIKQSQSMNENQIEICPNPET